MVTAHGPSKCKTSRSALAASLMAVPVTPLLPPPFWPPGPSHSSALSLLLPPGLPPTLQPRTPIHTSLTAKPPPQSPRPMPPTPSQPVPSSPPRHPPPCFPPLPSPVPSPPPPVQPPPKVPPPLLPPPPSPPPPIPPPPSIPPLPPPCLPPPQLPPPLPPPPRPPQPSPPPPCAPPWWPPLLPPSIPPTDMVNALVELWEATNGSGWRQRDRWLEGEPCINQWYGVYCCPDTHPILDVDGGIIEGHGCLDTLGTRALPTQMGAGCSSGKKTGTTADVAVCRVVALHLESNGLLGELGERVVFMLPSLQWLALGNNRLTGVIPSALGTLGMQSAERLQRLSMAGNEFWHDSSRSTLQQLVQRCKEAGMTCTGLPPKSCSAFGGGVWMVKAEDPDTCEKCGGLEAQLALLAIALLIFLLFVCSYVWLINRYTDAIRKWVSTASIVITHLQTLRVIALLRLHWPSSVERTVAFFSVDFLDWGDTRPECLASGLEVNEDAGGTVLLYKLARVMMLFVLLQSIALIQVACKVYGRWRGWSILVLECYVDRLEVFETIFFSIQISTSIRLCVQLIDSINAGGLIPLVAGVVAWLLLATQGIFIFKYFCAALTLTRLQRQLKLKHWLREGSQRSLEGRCDVLTCLDGPKPGTVLPEDRPETLQLAMPHIPSAHSCAPARVTSCNNHTEQPNGFALTHSVAHIIQRHGVCASASSDSVIEAPAGRLGRLWQRAFSSRWWSISQQFVLTYILRFGSRNKSIERLQRRLRYVTKRYEPGAWYWQFVIWLRQIVLILLVVLPQSTAGWSGTSSSESINSSDITAANGSTIDMLIDATPSMRALTRDVGSTIAQAVGAILLFVFSLIWHRLALPFPYQFQNRLDTLLFLADILLICLAIVYTLVVPSIMPTVEIYLEVMMLLIIILSFVGTLCYILYRWWQQRSKRRRRNMPPGMSVTAPSEPSAQQPFPDASDDDGDDFGTFTRSRAFSRPMASAMCNPRACNADVVNNAASPLPRSSGFKGLRFARSPGRTHSPAADRTGLSPSARSPWYLKRPLPRTRIHSETELVGEISPSHRPREAIHTDDVAVGVTNAGLPTCGMLTNGKIHASCI